VAMDSDNTKDKALNYANAGFKDAATGGNAVATASYDPVSAAGLPVTEDEERAYTEMAMDWLNPVTDERKRKAMQDYHRDLNARAERFYQDMIVSLYRLKHEIQEQVMEDPEISASIEKHFDGEGKKFDWTVEETKKHIEDAKQCLGDFLHGKAVENYAFQAVLKNEHHKDVAGTLFFNAFFRRLSDPTVRKHAMKRAREILKQDGYSDQQITKMFGTTPPVKVIPRWGFWRRDNGRVVREVKGITLQTAGLQSEVWSLIKKDEVNKAVEMTDELVKKTGIPGHLASAAVAKVGKTLTMYNGLPPAIKSRMQQFAKRVDETYARNMTEKMEHAGAGGLINTINAADAAVDNADREKHPEQQNTGKDVAHTDSSRKNEGVDSKTANKNKIYPLFKDKQPMRDIMEDSPDNDGGPSGQGPGGI